MLRFIPSITTIFLVVILPFSVAATESSEIFSEALTSSQDTEHGTVPNRDSSKDKISAAQHWISDFRHRLQQLNKWLDKFTEKNVEQKFTEFSPKARGSLLRMPRGFGNRQSEKDDVIGFFRTSKSQLSRMPMSFGKRDVFDVPVNDLYGQKLPDGGGESKTGYLHEVVNNVPGSIHDKDDFSRTRKGKLGRMPMAFGKRSETSAASDGALRKNNISEMQKQYDFDYRPVFDDIFERVAKDKLGRMPMAYGKRSGTSTASDEVLQKSIIPGAQNKYAVDFRPIFDGEFERVAKDRLGRMPMAYGKRIPHSEYAPYVESQQGAINMPYVNFGKPALGDNDQFQDVILTKLTDDMVSAGSEYDNKIDHEDSNLYSRLSRGSLNRMPLSFGKRSVPDKMATSLSKKAVANGYAAVRADRGSKIFGKRNPNKYQVLLQMLGSKFNSLKPEIKDSVHGKIQTLLNQFLEKQSSLTRLPRSKLERMPITYGKRREGYNGQVEDVNTKYSRVTRPKLGRMPLTFGKRLFYPRYRNSFSKMHSLTVGVHPAAGEDEGNKMSGPWSSGDTGLDSALGCVSLTDGQHQENNIMCKSKQRKQR